MPGIRERLFNPLLQFSKVRTRPVNLFAVRTAAKLVVINFRKRLELLDYVRLRCILQRRVTSQAPRKRGDQIRKIKTADNFDRLFVSILGTWIIPVL
ncbi:MAG TPA: hypothetical protein VIG87_05925, partial [Candidatus Udaeobacter sp.]